jgi:hypothetical protein
MAHLAPGWGEVLPRGLGVRLSLPRKTGACHTVLDFFNPWRLKRQRLFVSHGLYGWD